MTYDSFFDAIERRLLLLRSSRSDPIEGATYAEIAAVEEYAGRQLPSAYRDFLHRMGRDAGALFLGSDYSIKGLLRLQYRDYAVRLLRKRESSFDLPESAFVFMMHQGYRLFFFYLDQGEDPPVYFLPQGEPLPKLLSNHFTSYLETYVTELEQLAIKEPSIFAFDDEVSQEDDCT